MGLAAKVLEMQCHGHSAGEVCQALGLAPSRLKRVIEGPAMRKLLKAHRMLSAVCREATTNEFSQHAQRCLAELAGKARSSETARKAACRLMDDAARVRQRYERLEGDLQDDDEDEPDGADAEGLEYEPDSADAFRSAAADDEPLPFNTGEQQLSAYAQRRAGSGQNSAESGRIGQNSAGLAGGEDDSSAT